MELGLLNPGNPIDFVPQFNAAGTDESLTGLIQSKSASFKTPTTAEIEQLLTHDLDTTKTLNAQSTNLTLPSQDWNLSLTTGSSQNSDNTDPLTGQAVTQAESTAFDRVIEAVYHSLTEFADKGGITELTSAFGNHFNAEMLENIRQQWAVKNFEQLPAVEIRSSEELKGANGAFSRDTNTIYLSREYIKQNAANPEAITSVLLEETGHYIDSRINSSDAVGDEGAIFAALVQNVKLDQSALQALKTEDDTATIALEGQAIYVEQSSAIKKTNYPRPSSGEYRVALWGDDTNSGLPGSPWRTLEKAVKSAPSGSTIVIRRGTYHEGDLQVSKQLTFQPFSREQVWLDGNQQFERSLNLGRNSGYSVIRGLGFKDYIEEGLSIWQNSSNVTVENNVFTENADSGLGVSGTDATVRGNTFSYNGQQGMHGVGADRILFEDNVLNNNNVNNFPTNHRAAGAKFVRTDSFTVQDNVFKDNQSNGLWIDMSSSNVTVTGNTVKNNQGMGIFFELSHNATITSNQIVGNDVHGISVYDSSNANIYNNTFSKNAININIGDGPRVNYNSEEVAAGITWQTANNVVKDNTFLKTEGGVEGWGSLHLNIFTGVELNGRQLVADVSNNTYSSTSSGSPDYAVRYRLTPQPDPYVSSKFKTVQAFSDKTGFD